MLVLHGIVFLNLFFPPVEVMFVEWFSVSKVFHIVFILMWRFGPLLLLSVRVQEYTGTLMELCQSRRGTLIDLKFTTPTRGSIVYEIPLAEVGVCTAKVNKLTFKTCGT